MMQTKGTICHILNSHPYPESNKATCNSLGEQSVTLASFVRQAEESVIDDGRSEISFNILIFPPSNDHTSPSFFARGPYHDALRSKLDVFFSLFPI